MSRTFKTDPTWVKLRRDHKARREVHFHENGECDFDEYIKRECSWWPRHCGYTVSYYGWHDGFFARPPRGRSYRQEHEGRMRAGLRKAKHEILKLSREDMEDYDIKSYQHRHSALWEMY